MSREHQPIFGHERSTSIGLHNVGNGGVLEKTSQTVIDYVDSHYGARCGHIAKAQVIGVLVPQVTDEVREQLKYLSSLYGQDINAYTWDDMREQPQDTLVVPYINTQKTDSKIRSLGYESFGLPQQMVHELKNKAQFHKHVENLAVEGFETPSFTICSLDELTSQALELHKKTVEMYQEHGFVGILPEGEMIRASESDGGYGSAKVYKSGRNILVALDGDTSQVETILDTGEDAWKLAYHRVYEHLSNAMNIHIENRVVVNRLMKLEDSPGLSVIILNGEVISLGWNGQVQTNGGTACVGTSQYKAKNTYLSDIQGKYEDQTAASFGEFLVRLAKQQSIDFSLVSGFANIDIMILSQAEAVFQQKAYGKTRWVSVAECNPRLTNFTDALFTMGWVTKTPQTVAGLKSSISMGILTIDKQPVPRGYWTGERLREEIKKLDEKLQLIGARIVLRMPDHEQPGFILGGDVKLAKHKLEEMLKTR
jgi:hypothetical protein